MKHRHKTGLIKLLFEGSRRCGLTAREQELVELVINGLSNKEIAARCSISVHTVKDHLKHVYRKVGAGHRTELIARLVGLRPPE